MIDLKNLNIILTGGTGVIGNAIIDKLISAGAHVIATGTNEEKLKILQDKYKELDVIKFNLSDHGGIDKFVEDCSKNFSNKIDVLINNAGITQDNLSLRMKEDEWKNVIDINLTSTFLITKSVLKKMLKLKNGKIINVTSVVGHTGNIGQANYAASKAGIIAMSKSLALEYGKKNITVNCVSPGFIVSNMTAKISDEHTELMKSRISLNKFGNPEDIANSIAFLSSNLSNYITGETIHVNGGMYFS
jgi:3-oxoacyl-[acyl-carrier protein] reductase